MFQRVPKYLILFWIFLTTATSFGFVDYRLDYKTLHGKDVEIHFPEKFHDVALEVERHSLKVFADLQQVFKYKPSMRIHLIVSDSFDDANGFATVYPNNYILLQLRPPDSLSVLENYDNWLENLIMHEIGHIFQMEQSHGLWGASRYIWGRHPLTFLNGSLPHWMLEGHAVFLESMDGYGRLNSDLAGIYLKADLLANKKINLTQLSHFGYEYPFGNSAYLYGAKFIQFLAYLEKDSFHKFAQVFFTTSGYLFPFSEGGAISKVYGQSLDDLFLAWLKKDSAEMKQQEIKYKNQHPKYRPHSFNIFSEKIMRPRLSQSEGQLLISQTSSKSGNAIVAYNILELSKSQEPLKKNIQVKDTQPFGDFVLNKDGFFYTMLEKQNIYERRYQFTKVKDASSQLLLAGSSFDTFAFLEAPQKKIYYSQYADGIFYLRCFELATKTTSTLWQSNLSIENIRVKDLKVMWTIHEDGRYKIILFDMVENTFLKIQAPQNMKQADFIDSSWIVFSANLESRYNIYSVKLEKNSQEIRSKSAVTKARQHTYEYIGAFSPQLDIQNKLLYFEKFDQNNFQLASIPLDDTASVAEELKITITKLDSQNLNTQQVSPRKSEPANDQDYSTWNSFVPFDWEPFLSMNIANDIQILNYGAKVNLQDVLQYHRLGVSLGQNLVLGNLELAVNYSLFKLYPNLSISAAMQSIGFKEDLLNKEIGEFLIKDEAMATISFPYVVHGDDYLIAIELGIQNNVQYFFWQNNWFKSSQENLIVTSVFMADRRDIYYGSFVFEKGDLLSLKLTSIVPMDASFFIDASLWYEYNFIGFFSNQALRLGMAGFSRFNQHRGNLAPKNFSSFLTSSADSLTLMRGYKNGSIQSYDTTIISIRYVIPICYCQWAVQSFDYLMLSKVGLSIANQNGFFTKPTFDSIKFATNISTELFFDFKFGYRLDLRFSLGVAAGVGEGAETQYFFKIGNDLALSGSLERNQNSWQPAKIGNNF